MAFVPVPNGFLARVRYTLFDQLIENTLWFITADPPSEVLTPIASTVLDAWGDNVMPLLSQDLTLREVYVTDESEQNGGSATATFGTGPLAGGVSNSGLPGNVALCVSFRTAQRGRSFRGRIYLPGLYETAVTGNQIGSTIATSLVNAVETAVAAVEALGAIHAVVSRYANGAPRTTAVATPVVAYLATDLTVDSQRRRLTNRGA